MGIVDGFNVCDEILCSTLGSYDGNVYERHVEQAKNSPLNREAGVNLALLKYLRPLLSSGQ